MVQAWLLEPGEHRPPQPPAESTIQDELETARENPLSEPDTALIRSALTSQHLGQAYVALACIQQYQEQHPELVDQLEDEVLAHFQNLDNAFLGEKLLTILYRQSKIDDDSGGGADDFTEFADPELNSKLRAPALAIINQLFEGNHLTFRQMENGIREALTSPWPSIQAPALDILRSATEQSATIDASDYSDELMQALYVDDEEVQAKTLPLLEDPLLENPHKARAVSDRVFELLEAPSPRVRAGAFIATIGILKHNQDLAGTVSSELAGILCGDDAELIQSPETPIDDESRVVGACSLVLIEGLLYDERTLDGIDTDRLLDWFDTEHIGTPDGVMPIILFAEIARYEPASIAELVPALQSALQTGRTERSRALEDTALCFGRFASARPEAVEELIDSHLDALGDPDIEDGLIAWELAHIAIGAPEQVRDAIGITEEWDWSDDPFGDNIAATMLRGMLSEVAPGYALPDDERAENLVETVFEICFDDDMEGYCGRVLCRVARSRPELLDPYEEQLVTMLQSGHARRRKNGAVILAETGNLDTLKANKLPCKLTESVIEEYT